MATLEQERAERAALQQVLSRISRLSGPELARSESGSDVQFESGVVFFNRILRLFRDLDGVALEDIPYSKLTILTQTATNALELLQEASDSRVSHFPRAKRDSILQRAGDEYEGMFETVAPILAFSVRDRIDSKVNLALLEARQTLTQAKRIAEEGAVLQSAVGYHDDAKWLRPFLLFAFATALIGIGLILKFFEVV